MPETLPSWDEAVSGQGGQTLPSWDDAMKQSAPSALSTTFNAAKAGIQMALPGQSTPEQSEAVSAFFHQTAAGRIAKAVTGNIGESLTEGGALGLSPETEGAFKKAGIFNDYAKGRNDYSKAFNEALIRPAAVGLDATLRAGTALFTGAQGLVAQTGAELGHPELGRELAAVPEAFMGMGPGSLGKIHAPLAPEIAQGKVAGVFDGEAEYMGTKERTPQQVSEANAAAKDVPALPEEPEAVFPDIHAMARNIAPEVFSKYDDLDLQREDLRNQISELSEKNKQASVPHTDEDIADLEAKIEDANPRKTKIYQERLDTWKQENEEALKGVKETDEITALRAELQKADYAMRDLAPEVSRAYRTAHEFLPEEKEPAKVLPPVEATPVELKPADVMEEEKLPAEIRPPVTSIEEQKNNIISAETKKLIAAGRPSEEANAAAQLVAEHYQARSERFGGKNGTAEEMYKRDSANIRAGREQIVREKVRALAQSTKNTDPEGRMAEIERQLDSGKLSKEQRGDLLDEMDKLADKAIEKYLPQGELLKQAKRGSIRLATNNAKATITLMRSANASTFIHETGHHWLDELMRDAKEDNAPEGLKKDAETLNKWLGVKTVRAEEPKQGMIRYYHGTVFKDAKDFEGKTFVTPHEQYARDYHGNNNNLLYVDIPKDKAIELGLYDEDNNFPRNGSIDNANTQLKPLENQEEIKTAQHEKFARGFERYLMEGTAPSKALANVFGKFKQWLTQIYQTVNKLRSPITDDIRDVFDRLLSSNPEKIVIAPERGTGEIIGNIHEKQAEHTPLEKADEVGDKIEATVDRIAKQNPEIENALKAAKTNNIPSEAESTTGSGQPAEPISGRSNPAEQPNPVAGSGGKASGEGASTREQSTVSAGGETKPGSGTAEGEPIGPNAKFGRESDLVDKAGNIRLDNLNTPEDINQVLRDAATENDNFMGARRGVISAGEQLDLADALGMDAASLNMRKIGQAYNAEQILAARKLLIQSATSVREAMQKAATGTDADVMAYAEAKTRHQMIQEQVSGITAEAGRALGAFRKLAGSEEAKSIGDFLKEATGKDLFQLKEEAQFGMKLDSPAKVSRFINDSKLKSFKSMVLEYYINNLISGPITHLRYSVGNALNAIWTPLAEIPTAATIGAIRETISGQPVLDRVYLGEAGAQLHGLFTGAQKGLYAAAEAFKTGNSPALPTEKLPGHILEGGAKMNAIPGTLGKIINIPSKSVSAIHSFFKSIRYEQNIHGLAYREAMKEGLDGDAFTNRVSDLTTGPTPEMMEEATAGALKELYMSPTDYHSAMGALTRFTNQSLLAKIIVPFMKIGSQITRNAFIERTPLGIFDKDVRANLLGVNGKEARDFQLGKISTGVTLIGGTSLLVAQGLATGDGPTDPKQRALWLLNHQPNSLQIGNISIKYQGLGHIGMLMRFSANMTETAQLWNEEDGDKLAKSFFEGITRSVLDENFMRGLKDMLDAVYHPEEYGSSYIKGFVTNWLPFSVGQSQVAREIDPYHREAHSIFEAARAKIPFVSEGLQPKRDVFGEPIPNGGPLPDYANDPVVQRMEALQIGVGKLDRKIRGIPLNEQQYDDYSRIAGRMAKMQLNSIVVNPGFSQVPVGAQIEVIKKIIDSSRETARNVIMMQNPGIIRQATQAKLDAIRTGKKPSLTAE